MGFNPVDKTTPSQGQHIDANGSAQVMLYDQFGNPVAYQNKSAPTAPISGIPMMGLDGDSVLRIARSGAFGTLRSTSEITLWHDAFEGSTINGFWTQSLTTMTAVQATGILTLNNSAITTLNTDAIITSQRQFPKYPRNPLFARFRANLSANPVGHTLAEMGFGAPSGVTAIISNGAFFRFTAAGDLVAVTSYGGTENVSSILLAQGLISTTSYYYFDVVVDDDFARFIVADSNGTPVVETTLRIPVQTPYTFAVSHTPSFARVYVDATGGGTAVQLKIASHTVQMQDNMFEKSWDDQQSSQMRQASINPTTFAQTGSSMTAAPATQTPSNTVGGYNALGGDYANALTSTAAEAPLSVFAFQIPSPYSFYLKGLIFSLPVVTTAIAVTGLPFIEWFVIANCASGNISTGGGQRFPVGINHYYTSITQAAGVTLNLGGGVTAGAGTAGGPVSWSAKVPILCLPGTFLHIGYKVFVTSATATPGVTRGSVFVDGYFE